MFHLRRWLVQPLIAARTQGRVCTQAPDNMSQVNVISYDELKKVTATGGAQIFDVRTPEEVAKGKIPTAVNIPVDEIEQALKMDPETFKKKYLVSKPQPEDNIIVHCQMGRRGARAAEIAMAQGFATVRNYVGGYKEWSDKEKH